MTDFINKISIYLEITGLLSSLAFSILFILKNRYSWLFSMITSIVYFVVFLKSGLVASSITAIFFGIMSLYMFYYGNLKYSEKEFDIKIVPVYHNVFYIVFGILLFTCFFVVLKPISYNVTVLLDSICISCIIITIWLFIKRVTYAWLYWIILCIMYTALFFIAGLKVMATGQILNIVIGIYGYYSWNKFSKNKDYNQISDEDNTDIDKNLSE